MLTSGTGASIVTSPAMHDASAWWSSVCRPVTISNWRIKSWTLCSNAPSWCPLAVGVHADRKLLQFCYTSEVADSALKLLDEAGLPGELRLRQKLALVAMVGAGVTCNPLHCHRFWQQLKGQPVEFTWQSEEGIRPGGGATRRADGKPDPGAASVLVSRRKAYWPDVVRQRDH
ncbi:hypothetical protein MJK72_01175 [Klebsiella pneumoniae]|nr:hypothetical protein MJK72_01175 [Klebsiella pneumoniae]